jgi:hypothetical protein
MKIVYQSRGPTKGAGADCKLREAFPICSAVAFLCFAATAFGAADENYLAYSDATVYRIKMTTSLDLPRNSGIPRIKVSQALPVKRPWSEGEHDSSARNIEFQPGNADFSYDRKTGASFITWEERVPSKGGPMVFTTTYETTSVAREISPDGEKTAKWKSRRVQTDKGMHPEIVEQAKILIEESTPIEALRKFSEWLEKRVTYDASVPNTSVDDIMSNGAGHCGHRVSVLLQFTAALGIASRPIGGANLTDPAGGLDGDLFKLRPTWSNNHAWVELDIPGLGWVEIEPVGKDKIFSVPARYIQTRGNFQNHEVRIMEGGKWVGHRWETVSENGKNRFASKVGLRNVITYEVLGEKAGEAIAKLGLPGALNAVGGLLRYRKPDGVVRVEIRGSFDNWQNGHVLTASVEDAAIAQIDVKSLGLGEGKYEFKFLVDGNFEDGQNRTLLVGPDGSLVN